MVASTLVDLLLYWLIYVLLISLVSKCAVNQYVSHVNWFCVYKSKEGGYILTDILQWKFLSATRFWICDLPTQIFCTLQQYLPYRIWPFSWLRTVGPHSSSQNPALVLSAAPGVPKQSPIQVLSRPNYKLSSAPATAKVHRAKKPCVISGLNEGQEQVGGEEE